MAPNSSDEKHTNPNEYLNIPKWINEDYFQPILEKDVPNYERVKKFTPIAATAPGENYTSIMVRVVMDVQLKDGSTTEISYILKTGLDAGNQGAILVASMELFPKEMQMYQTILPKFTKLYREAGLDIDLAPKCVNVESTPERITLVMEDLKRRNFKNIDRLKGFDMPHIERVLMKIAELHAVSALYYELNGPYDEMFNKTFYSEQNRPIFDAMFEGRQTLYIKAMREWGLENVDYYLSKLSFSTEFFDEAIRMNKFDPTEFNVLNHGDCWSNNIMFRYKDNGDIDEVLFIDFQVGKWGTPAQDLWYMICNSASLDIKVKEYDRFVCIYHQRLVECLKALKYPKTIPTLKDVHMLMLKYGFWSILTAYGPMPAILYPSDKDANMESMLKLGPEGDELRYKTFVSPYYAKAMCQLLPFLDNKGVLDRIP